MGKIIVGLLLAALLVVSVLDWNRSEELQVKRSTEQGQLLAELESLHKPAVSKLVDEWRNTYRNPSQEELTELKVMVERVKDDPVSAEKYTASAKQKKLDELPFTSPLGTRTAKPGLI